MIPGTKINGHKILDIKDNIYYVICGTCKAYTTKNKANLYRNKHCWNCKKTKIHSYCGRSVRQWSLILGLNEATVKSRIYRGWSVKQAIFEDCIVRFEYFTEKDLNYISKFYTSNYELDKKQDEKAIKKYNLKKKYETKTNGKLDYNA